jgi:3-oxoacyl-[acyl-carrier-protein] synthase II
LAKDSAGRRRVVVTGIGLVTPLGCGTSDNWAALSAGRSGTGPVTRFDASPSPSRVAGEVRGFEAERFLDRKEQRRTDLFVQYALAAAQLAVDEAGLRLPLENPARVGAIVGTGIGGIKSVEDAVPAVVEKDVRRISPFLIPRLIPSMAASQVAMRFGARGPSYATSSACASGAHALGDALQFIREGTQDVVIAGGAEAPICLMGFLGFAAMRALSTGFNETPERASRPFDVDRDGFVMGEGAGILVLESLEHARARGARPLVELAGYGATCDAHHLTQPEPDGAGAATCMTLALEDAGLVPGDLDYVNAHGTGTELNDAIETQAIKRVFGEHAARLAVSSTKSMTGHLLGAAGAVEAAFTALAIVHGMAPPTINLDRADEACDLDYVPHRARPLAIRAALSNSFGFGGTNACVALRRID